VRAWLRVERSALTGAYAEARNHSHAAQLFDAAARIGGTSAFEAQYHLGTLFLDEYRTLSARSTDTPDPHADINTAGACASAVSFFKAAAECGAWDGDAFLQGADDAWAEGTPRGKERAIGLWALAEEMGYEAAQSNLAFVRNQDAPPERWDVRLASVLRRLWALTTTFIPGVARTPIDLPYVQPSPAPIAPR
jgi:hypothetical protein